MKKKNNLKEARFRFLIYEKENKFVGICKETGYVEEGESAKEVFMGLRNGTKAIVEAVKKNDNLLPSINYKPSIKYQFLFFFIPIWYSLKNFVSSMPGELELIDRTLAELNKEVNTCGV